VKSLLASVKNFLWPQEKSVRIRRAELTFWAFLLAVAYLPLAFGFLAWFVLARPLAIFAELKGKEVFTAAYFYSFMANLFQLYWVAVVTPPGMVAAIFILSLYPAIIISVFVKICRKKKALGLIVLPFLWVGMEYFRGLSEFAFPWTDLSYSQGYYLTFIQIVSVIGCYGLSFILILLNVFVWHIFSRHSRLETRVSNVIAFLAVVVAVYLYGWVVFAPYPEPGKYRVSLLQGNVDLETKWQPETRMRNFELYDSLAQAAIHGSVDDSVDLIIWPETAAPTYFRYEPQYSRLVKKSAVKSGVPNLVGALDIVNAGGKRKTYNAAFQIMPDGTLNGIYHKVNLVPFSEHSPYQDYIPFLTKEFLEKYLAFIRTHKVQWWSDFYPGDSIVVFEAGGTKYTVLICFEVAFPDFVRQGLLKGADFIVTITNDTWFGRSPGPFQHMRIAVFRAVENRVWMARCANSGISAVVDPYGREMVRAGLYVRDILTADISPIEEHSAFTRTGPIVGRVSFWVTIVILFGVLIAGLSGFYSKRSLDSFLPSFRRRH
jgi:apolipoprotein N-acyltransferase